MAPAGFGIAAQQGRFISPDVDKLRQQSRIAAERGQGAQHRLRVEAAATGVDTDRDVAVGAGGEIFQHANRRVVHGVVARVFQRVEDRGLAAAGQAGDQDDPARPGEIRTNGGRVHGAKAPATWDTRPRAQSSARATRSGAEAMPAFTRTSGRSSVA